MFTYFAYHSIIYMCTFFINAKEYTNIKWYAWLVKRLQVIYFVNSSSSCYLPEVVSGCLCTLSCRQFFYKLSHTCTLCVHAQKRAVRINTGWLNMTTTEINISKNYQKGDWFLRQSTMNFNQPFH